jgi:ATP synthase protein I
MPDNHDSRDGPLGNLETRLETLEAKRRRPQPGEAGSLADGYRFLANMLGGVLAGIGFGWTLDHFAGTAPWGIVGGLLIGSGVSIVSVVRTAGRLSDQARANAPPVAPVPPDEDDED